MVSGVASWAPAWHLEGPLSGLGWPPGVCTHPLALGTQISRPESLGSRAGMSAASWVGLAEGLS